MTFQTELFGVSNQVEKKVCKLNLTRVDKLQIIREKINQGKERTDLFTVNSISGGRSSAYMAYHNRADINIFSIVQTNDPRCHFKDSAVREYVWRKCGTDLVYSTLEDDDTIKSVMELEQYMGDEIFMVYGASMDDIISNRKYLPNSRSRFCTTEMKLKPIFEFLNLKGLTQYHNLDNPTYKALGDYYRGLSAEDKQSPYYRINIGYRIDDYERVANFTETFKYVDGVHESGTHAGKRRWNEAHWRVGHFPIISKTQSEVINFWKDKPVSFPEFNNCEFCFHRSVPALKKQLTNHPRKAVFWKDQEKRLGASFHKVYSLEEIENMEFTEDMDFTADSMCDSGGCTD